MSGVGSSEIGTVRGAILTRFFATHGLKDNR